MSLFEPGSGLDGEFDVGRRFMQYFCKITVPTFGAFICTFSKKSKFFLNEKGHQKINLN